MDLPVPLAMYWSGPLSVLAWLWMARVLRRLCTAADSGRPLHLALALAGTQLVLDLLWMALHWHCSGDVLLLAYSLTALHWCCACWTPLPGGFASCFIQALAGFGSRHGVCMRLGTLASSDALWLGLRLVPY